MKKSLIVAVLEGLLCAGGCAGFNPIHGEPHDREPSRRCDTPPPDRRREVAGWPGLFTDKRSYGGTSSWTADGDPPAGDSCPRPPPSVRPRP